MELQIKLSAEQCPCGFICRNMFHSSGKVKICQDEVSISSHGSRILNYFYLPGEHMLQANVHFLEFL
jgi:hypothetical protein